MSDPRLPFLLPKRPKSQRCINIVIVQGKTRSDRACCYRKALPGSHFCAACSKVVRIKILCQRASNA